MSGDQDPNRTVEYYTAATNQLRLAMWALFASVLLLAMSHERDQPVLALPGLAALLVALVFTLRATRRGRPVLMLSPQGINYRGGGSEVFVPWQVVVDVDTVNFTTGIGKRRWSYRDITMVLVPEAFYRAHIHKDSTFGRGPDWDRFYRPRGALVELAIHHDRFAVEPAQVRGPIETRWLTFRDKVPAPPAEPAPHAFGRYGAPLTYRTGIFSSPWQMAGILLPVVGVLAVLVRLAGWVPSV